MIGRMPTPDFVRELRAKIGTDLLPMVGVTGVVRNASGEVLLGKRSDTGEWALPTGIVEPMEQPAHALVREVLEESGVAVRVESLVAVTAMDHEVVYANGDRACFIDIAFVCRAIAGEPAPADGENTEVAWFAMDDLPPLRVSSQERLDLAVAYAGTTHFMAPVAEGDRGA